MTKTMRKPILLFLFAFAICHCNTMQAQNSQCPANLDFEQGNLNNWEFFIGNCCPFTMTTTPSAPVVNRHVLMSGTGTDPYGGFPVVPPGGGNFSLKLGNDGIGRQAERARYYVRVPTNPNAIYTLLYKYAVVFEDPNHQPSEQPRFNVVAFDSATGAPIPCNDFTFIATSSLPGFQASTVRNGVLYRPWTTSSIDLSQMAGRTVGIDFTTGDCDQGGHFGYAYIDVSCNFFQSTDYYCPNTTTITLEAPPGFEKYEWWDDNFTTQLGTTQDVSIPTPPNTRRYAVILEPYVGFGCPDTIYTQYSIHTMEIDVTLDTSICTGDSAQLSSGTNSSKGPFTYQWSPLTGIGCPTCDSPKASPPALTKYYITVTDNDGCSATDSVVVRVDDPPFIDLKFIDTTCSSYEVEILNDITNNPINTQYQWTLSDNGKIADGIGTSKIKGVWFSDGTKKITLFAINGLCSSIDSDYIYVHPSPIADFDLAKDVCVGTTALLKPYNDDNATDWTYHWSIDEHNITSTTYNGGIHLNWQTIGKKRIFLKTINEYNCIDSSEKNVGVHNYPIASIIRVDADDMCYGKKFTLGTQEQDPRTRIFWSPPQYLDNNGLLEVTGTAEKTGYIYLNVTNTWGCTTADSLFIPAESCCDVFMPNAFTPNNDGENDTYWSPDIYKHRIIKLMIANRRGQIVYETTTTDEGWDGTFNGQPLGMDTYHYYLQYYCNEDEVVTKKGDIILLR